MAKSRTDLPLDLLTGLTSALYPNVRMRAELMSRSCERNTRGQNKSESLFLDHVIWLVPPRPWTKTMFALIASGGVCKIWRPSKFCIVGLLDFRDLSDRFVGEARSFGAVDRLENARASARADGSSSLSFRGCGASTVALSWVVLLLNPNRFRRLNGA